MGAADDGGVLTSVPRVRRGTGSQQATGRRAEGADGLVLAAGYSPPGRAARDGPGLGASGCRGSRAAAGSGRGPPPRPGRTGRAWARRVGAPRARHRVRRRPVAPLRSRNGPGCGARGPVRRQRAWVVREGRTGWGGGPGVPVAAAGGCRPLRTARPPDRESPVGGGAGRGGAGACSPSVPRTPAVAPGRRLPGARRCGVERGLLPAAGPAWARAADASHRGRRRAG